MKTLVSRARDHGEPVPFMAFEEWAPQLAVLSAVPERRIGGDPSETDTVLVALGGAIPLA